MRPPRPGRGILRGMFRSSWIMFVLAIAMPSVAAAQFLLPGFEGAVRMTMSPLYPRPGEAVTVTLESSLVNLQKASVAWQIDGEPTDDTGTAITVMAPALGTSTRVVAEIVDEAGSLLRASTDIRPTEIDLLYESDSYVPPFYGGRMLPSAGTTVRLQAMPRFKRGDGTFIPSSDIIYTWRRNGRVLGNLSGRGRSSLSASAPLPLSTDVFSVEAESTDGMYAGEARTPIRSIEPVVRIYEDHPLFGLRLNHAFASTTRIVGTEATLAALPLFAPVSSPIDRLLAYDWSVNGRLVDTTGNSPNAITIGAPQGGEATIRLSISHGTNIFFGTDDLWTLRFTSESGENNPFVPR